MELGHSWSVSRYSRSLVLAGTSSFVTFLSVENGLRNGGRAIVPVELNADHTTRHWQFLQNSPCRFSLSLWFLLLLSCVMFCFVWCLYVENLASNALCVGSFPFVCYIFTISFHLSFFLPSFALAFIRTILSMFACSPSLSLYVYENSNSESA